VITKSIFSYIYYLNNLIKWKKIKNDLKNIKLLFLDVDGVLTDGGLYINEDGQILKKFDVKDGLGLKLLKESGIKVVFISGGVGGATEKRAKQLGIEYCLVGVQNKYREVKNLQRKLNISKTNTAYLGDDINDMVVKPLVKLLFTTADGSKLLKRIASASLNNNGGNKVVRELAERILISKKLWKQYSLKGWIERND